MVHNRECLKCGSIGEWNWAPKKVKATMPNGETVLITRIRKGQPAIKCPKCKHKFEPHSHAKLNEALTRVSKELNL